MKVKAIGPFGYEHKRVAPEQELDLPEAKARGLIACKLVVPVPETAQPEAAVVKHPKKETARTRE